LMSQDLKGAQLGTMKEDVKQAITQLGLDYRLMTQFTSFVAVEEMIVTDGGQPRRVDVPVEIPEGVNRAGIFGDERSDGSINAGRGYANFAMTQNVVVTTRSPERRKAAGGGGGGGGAGTGSVGGVGGAAPAPKPVSNPMLIADKSEADSVRVMTTEEKERSQLQSKFHPTVLAVVDRLKNPKLVAGPDESKFIHNGKAEIQIWLTDKSDETMAKLKELGFEVVLDPKTAKMVIGRLPVEKLAALAELKFVRYVSPQISN
jgi:Ca-activated chloride channel homolog